MSRAYRDLHRRRFTKKLASLRDMLSRCDDKAFLQLAWAVNMLQSDFGADVRHYLRYPPEAKTTKVGDPYAVYKWDIETLIILILTTKKYDPKFSANGVYRCDHFDTIARAINLLHDVENHEGGFHVNNSNILMEMHRIGHRQFGWQRGFATSERLYRFAYVYAQGACSDYFEETYGLTISEFMQVGFVLFAQFHRYPWSKVIAVDKLGLELALIEKALPLMSCSLTDVRAEASNLITNNKAVGQTRIAYMPSAIRRYPIVRDLASNTYISPLPQLIMSRITVGLYYDICSGPQELMNDANNRFEEYVSLLIKGFNPRFEVFLTQEYGAKKSRLRSPYVLIEDNKKVVAVIECKATKLTYEAQFSENPIEDAKGAYAQIVKGIVQIWKFFSHARRGIYADKIVAENAHGVLLTMDAWMQMSDDLVNKAMDLASEQLKNDCDVLDSDKRKIIFCSMQDLSDIMFVSNEDEFLDVFENAKEKKYVGWNVVQIRREFGGFERKNDFPLDISEILPWWGTIDEQNGKGAV